MLPGAFSAYRYKALLNGPDGKGPLASYFKGETMHGGSSDAGLFGKHPLSPFPLCYFKVFNCEPLWELTSYLWAIERNMYLAEDRILCFEIVTKKREACV